jgi:short-subunit dehydrogenase
VPRFKDQVVLVTGATSGIGLQAALAFAGEGAVVVGTGRDRARLDALAARVASVDLLDVTSDASVRGAVGRILDRHGRIDVLVNNAGVGLFKTWQQTPVDEMQRIMDVNLYGAVRVTRELLPAMLERRSGAIVNVASVAGKRAYAKHTAYCASKHALIGWSEALRCDLADTGVDVVVVCPPAVRTPFFENAGYMTFDQDHPGMVPMTPEDVATGILDATARRNRQSILSARAKVLYGLSLLSPGFVDTLRRFKPKAAPAA